MTTSMLYECRRSTFTLAGALLFGLGLQGCAAIPLAMVGGSALSTGGEAVVKAGTSYAADGTAYRTFALPIADVHGAVLEALQRTDVGVKREKTSKDGQISLDGTAEHRKIRLRLTPFTGTLTGMEISVKRNVLASDKATASELLGQVEQVLADTPNLAARADVTARSTDPNLSVEPAADRDHASKPRRGRRDRAAFRAPGGRRRNEPRVAHREGEASARD